MDDKEALKGSLRLGIAGAILTIVGVLASGPLAVLLVQATHPQPPWADAETFCEAYHPIQGLPYYFGFALVAGNLLFIAALFRISVERLKLRGLISLVLTGAFTTFIFLNYTIQIALIPALVNSHSPEDAPVIALLSFSNPQSLPWAIEMWGYAFLGAATWLMSAVFAGNRIERVTAGLMIANGVFCILGAVLASLDLRWVMSVPGLVAYATWNCLLLVQSVFVVISLNMRVKGLR